MRKQDLTDIIFLIQLRLNLIDSLINIRSTVSYILVMRAHQIVVMRDGFIIEVGNHQQLMEKKGHYADLVQKQMGVWQPEPEKTETLTPVV